MVLAPSGGMLPWAMPRLVLLLVISCIALLGAGPAGTYSGTWSGSSGTSGDFHISLAAAENGEWKSEVAFSLGGTDVKTKVTSVKVDGTKVAVVYQFGLQDTKLESTVTGQLNGKNLEGTYSTKVVADGSAVDEGTWRTTAAQ
jgi:hypothetical protein